MAKKETDTEKIKKANIFKAVLIFFLDITRLSVFLVFVLLLILLLGLFDRTLEGLVSGDEVSKKLTMISDKVEKNTESIKELRKIIINGYEKE